MAVGKITDSQFESEVLKSSTPVLIDFYAEWCGPCKQLGPTLEEVAAERTDIKIAKVNIDESPEAPQRYGVRGVPTMMIFKNGEVIAVKPGNIPKSKLVEWIDSNVA